MAHHAHPSVIRSSVVAVLVAISASTVLISARRSDGAPRPATAPGPVAVASHRQDIVLILTDDQRWDTLWAMPTVRSELVANGIEFSNGYVSNPVCCPSRSSILFCKDTPTTEIYTNHPKEPFGGFPAFHDSSTVATWLHDAGYRPRCSEST